MNNASPYNPPPRPIRFTPDDEAVLTQLKKLTGISISSLIRRSVNYAAPRFLNGSVNLLTLQDVDPQARVSLLTAETLQPKN